MTTTRITDLEKTLGELQARVAALGTLQIAMTLANARLSDGFEDEILHQLNLMRRVRTDDGEQAEAAIINGLIYQLHEQFGLAAND